MTAQESCTPDLGPAPKRIVVETAQVAGLVASQLPQWADLPLAPVAAGGWDNWTFRLGGDKVVRLPSASEYALAVEKEHRWLPRLAADLPLPIPTPLAQGVPGHGYPHPWSVYRWLEGRTASAASIEDPLAFADDLAAFLVALQAVDAAEGPRPGIHNWFRGATLRTYDDTTQRAFADLEGVIDVGAARDVWASALSAPWDGQDTWFHGDVAEGNLLLDDAGHLAAVIDFGTCGVGDPACDLAVAWTTLTADGRRVFRDRLAVDESTWERGRGWALWKAVATCWHSFEDPADADDLDRARRVVEALVGTSSAPRR